MSFNNCQHCGLVSKEITPELDDRFCCKGCELAYKIINNLGFQSYYQQKTINLKERNLKPDLESFIQIDEFATLGVKNYRINLSISGLHCAACVWLIENVLRKQENVVNARVNLTKRRLYLEWRGEVSAGNELVRLIFNLGYKLLPIDENFLQEEDKKYSNNLLKYMAVAGFGTGNIMLFSIILWFSTPQNMGIHTRDLLHFLSGIIALPIVIYSGRPFFFSAINAIKTRSVNMDVSISVAIILASIVSLIQTFRSGWDAYFDSAVMLIFFLLIGRYLDHLARKKAFNVAADFSLLNIGFAKIASGSLTKTIAIKDVKEGMILIIAAGEKIAADGVIIDGDSEVDTSLITGESLPSCRRVGDNVFGGTINLSSPIKVRVSSVGSESLLGKIIDLMEKSEQSKNKYLKLSDKLARIYTPLVHILALSTFLLSYFIFKQNIEFSLMSAVAVLVITCPCALALAIPIVSVITNSSLMKKSVLIKSGEALEKLNSVKTIIFDKTGSITKGNPQLVEMALISENRKVPLDDEQKEFYLQIAASLTKQSRHPISKAISIAYQEDLLDLKISEKAGFGLESTFNDKELKLGKQDFCLEDPVSLDFIDQNHLHCFMKYGNETLIFAFLDEIKEDAKLVISQLQKLGKNVILLSGDSKIAVERVAVELNIKEYYFNKTPIEKSAIINQEKLKNRVLMIGDGINDAPAIALADVSMSFCVASDITKNAADIIIQGQKLQPILTVFQSTKKSLRLMKENLLFALLYNAVAVPFAVMGYVTPLFAALAMSSSSLIVLLNSLRANTAKKSNF